MRTSARNHIVPRPFLKWAGGKGQLLDELTPLVAMAKPFGRYHEPFVGGGALFFALCRHEALPRKLAFLSDTNVRLMDAYRGVKDDVDRLIDLLKAHKQEHCSEHYYAVRAHVPEDPMVRAARIIYLNRTCYNGLFRENSKGQFNVPMGDYRNPAICDERNLMAAAKALRKAKLETRPFESVLDYVSEGDFVYFDPPYDPVSKTASFTAYAQGGFGEDAQRQLAEVFAKLDKRGVKVLLSNSYTPLVRGLYEPFTIDKVYATRRVNSRAHLRGKVSEALVRNY